MTDLSKIKPAHTQRGALVYVRQSSSTRSTPVCGSEHTKRVDTSRLDFMAANAQLHCSSRPFVTWGTSGSTTKFQRRPYE